MTATATLDFAAARRAMIDSQLRPSGINDPLVLAAMARVRREEFVPVAAWAAAYADRAVPLGGGAGFLSAPLVHARLLLEAAPRPDDHALVIADTGCLAELARPLIAKVVEMTPDAAAHAVPGGPYSLILIDGAAEVLPPSLAHALTSDGRLVTGIVTRGVTRLALARKSGAALALLPLADLGMPVLPAFAAPPRWSF